MSVAVLVCAGSIPATANAGARLGQAGHGWARLGSVRHGSARRGKANDLKGGSRFPAGSIPAPPNG